MTGQKYRVIADRDKGDEPRPQDIQDGDRYTLNAPYFGDSQVVRIERPVPTSDEPQKPELVTLHLYRDMCVGGLFLSERELDRTLHEHVEALMIRRDRLPSPHPPTSEQIAEALWRDDNRLPIRVRRQMANAVLALMQKSN